MIESDAIEGISLSAFPVGARLLVRSRTDWRSACISRSYEGTIVLTVASPSGRSYRLRRTPDAVVIVHGNCHVLASELDDTWLDNLTCYDRRW